MAATVAARSPSSSSRLEDVLAGAEDDLLHAEFPGILGTAFSPIRDVVLSPVLGFASKVIPGVATKIPFADNVAAFTLGATFGIVKTAYGVVPHQSVDNEAVDVGRTWALDAGKLAEAQISKPNPIGATVSFIVVKPKEIESLIKAAWGFGVTTVIDIVMAPFTGKLSDWIDTLKTFLGYLLYTGLDMEIVPAFMTPRVFDNLTIVANEQEKRDEVGGCESRRIRSAMENYPIPVEDFKPLMNDSARFFRYMTAAYGVSNIAAAKALTTHDAEKPDLLDIIMKPFHDFLKFVSNSSRTARKRKIAEYVNVDEDDIVHITPPGAETEDLGHFVAVDHKCKTVVLAIRGTYSLSEIFTDGKLWGTPFCGGVAHSGICENASNLWVDPETKEATETQKAVAKALLYNKAIKGELYKFVITGHSLGAGAACLLNLKIHHDNPASELIPGVKGVEVKCFGVASPPVYIPASSQTSVQRESIARAVAQCVCFIHEDDCVPFLSADAIRRLSDVLNTVDEQTKEMNFIEQRLTAGGIKNPNDIIVNAVKDGSADLPIKPMALRFAIPSSFVLWFRQSGIDKKHRPVFNAMCCDPNEICKRSILLSKTMITNHMPPFYERAVYSVLETIKNSNTNEICNRSILLKNP
uniref:sn-1-specific diacylglycerol lipase n=1 Tax=Odontella aurita TaxID=265563 RepID=A0A7S4K1T7_9STRA|mmetsp:Transcript_59454/g.176432  ORF Transcript_59454/g.176432 Transcript_59454/m.176432 type:complete len:639 (+) Transcript_59454:169-2085(+)